MSLAGIQDVPLRLEQFVITIVMLSVLIGIKKLARQSLKHGKIKEMPDDTPLELHAFGVINLVPILGFSPIPYIALALALAMSATVVTWTLSPWLGLTKRHGKRMYAGCVYIGLAGFLIGVTLFLSLQIVFPLLGIS